MPLELVTVINLTKGVFAASLQLQTQEWVCFNCVPLAASVSGVGSACALGWAVLSRALQVSTV